MTSLHSLLARLRQLQADLDRDPAPFTPAERIARQRAEVANDIAVLEDMIRTLARLGERCDRAA